jgi:hypothetical protein
VSLLLSEKRRTNMLAAPDRVNIYDARCRGDPDVGGPEVTKVETSCACANHQADNIDLIEPGPSAIHPNLLYTRAH